MSGSVHATFDVSAQALQLDATAQAGLEHRHAALPELRWLGDEDHRGHP